MLEILEVQISGVAPMLMSNGQLADPLNRWARELKKISGKRKKTDADHEEMARLEYMGGLWLDDDLEPCVPGHAMEACLVEGAKKTKQGKLATAGVLSDGDWKLQYKGSRKAEELWADERFRLRVPVRVQKARVMRTRPRFMPWDLTFGLQYDLDLLNRSSIEDIIRDAGRYCGLGDWRPRYGRFDVVSIEVKGSVC